MENWKEEVARMVGLEMIEEGKFRKAAAGALLGASLAGAGVGAYKAGAYNQRELDRDTIRHEREYSGKELKDYKYKTSSKLYGSELENMTPEEISSNLVKYFSIENNKKFGRGSYIESVKPRGNGLVEIKLVNKKVPYLVGIGRNPMGNMIADVVKGSVYSEAEKVKIIQLKYTSEFDTVAKQLHDAIDLDVLNTDRQTFNKLTKQSKEYQKEIKKEINKRKKQ